jgi:arylformamidase
VADLPGRVIDLPAGRRSVEPSDLPPAAELAGRAVLFRTGWSRNFATPPYFSGHPFVSAAAAAQLVAARAALVGIDSLNVDEVTGNARAHRAARRAHPDPVKLRGLGSFPVRAFAVLER